MEYKGKSFTDCTKVLEILKLSDERRVWQQTWNLSNQHQPEELFFFNEDFIRENASWLGMSDEIIDAFLQSRTMFRENGALQRLFWHCYYMLFLSEVPQIGLISHWPMIPQDVSEYSDMFYAFVFLSGVPVIRRIHREKMIPEDISEDTLSDFELWINEHRKRTGRWGFSQKAWITHHFSCDLFKLGRLQFQFHRCDFNFYVFKHRSEHKVIVFTPDGAKFRSDGQFDGANGIFDEKGSWSSYFRQADDYVEGDIISPLGFAENKRMRLQKSDWQLILQKGDPVLAVHIPATGAMRHHLCGESFRKAAEFFRRYFPGFKFQAFTCDSWLLDAQLEKYLPEESNIVKFLREFYLLPVPDASERQTFERVFGRKYDNLDEAPQETSLQRAVVEHCKNGGHWRNGGMIYFPQDIPKWGKCVYRLSGEEA